jgi:hypothetical protein
MAQITLQIKIDLPGLRTEIDKAIADIMTKFSAVGTIKVNADTAGASGAIRGIGSDVDEVNSKTHSVREAFSQWGMILTGIQAGIANVKMIMDKISEPVNVAEDRQKAMLAIQATLKSTGKEALMSADSILQMALNIQKITKNRFSVNDIMDASGFLLTFDNINDHILPKATQLVMDLSTKMRVDGRSAAISLGMALDNPVEGITRLSRAGIKFTSDERAVIKTLVEGGDSAKAQAMIFDMLEKKVGGFAANTVTKLEAYENSLNVTFKKVELDIGNSMTPALENVMDLFSKMVNFGLNNFSSLIGPLTAVTAAVIVYSNAVKIQTLIEGISIAAFKNSAIAMAFKNLMTNLSAQANDLAASSQLAYNILIDLFTGKISIATAASELYNLAVMTITASLTILSTALIAFGAVWMIYEGAAGSARREQANFTLEAERSRLGLKNLQSTLDGMSFEQLIEGIQAGEFQLKALEVKMKGLKSQTGTGVAWLDWLGSFGGTEKVYDDIAATKALISARQELNKGQAEQKSKITDSINYTNELTSTNVKQLKSLSQVEEAIRKVTLARKFSEDDSSRSKANAWLKQLDDLQKKYSASPEVEKKAVEESKKLAEDLAKAKVEALKDGKAKELAQLDSWYTEEKNKHEKSARWKAAIDEVYSDKKKIIDDKYANEEALRQKEIEKVSISLQEDSLQKRLALINNEYDQRVIKAKQANEDLRLIEQQRIEALKNADNLYRDEQYKLELDFEQKRLEINKSALDHRAVNAQNESAKEKVTRQIQMNFEINSLDIQAQKELDNEKLSNKQRDDIISFYLAKQQDVRDKFLDENKKKTKEDTDALSQMYEQHFNAIVNMATSATTSQQNFAKQLQSYLLQLLQQYVAKFISTKLAEITLFKTAEAAKTVDVAANAAAQTAIATTAAATNTATQTASMATIATAAAPAAALTSVATAGGSAWIGFAAIAAVMAAVIALTTGYDKGGYTGDGNEKDKAGIVHKGEYVFEADLVKGNVSKFDMIRGLLRSGVSLKDVYYNLSKKINPMPPLMHDAILKTNLMSPVAQNSAINNQTMANLKATLNEVKSVLNELKTKGIKADVAFEPVKVDNKISGSHIYISYELQKKIEDKKKA